MDRRLFIAPLLLLFMLPFATIANTRTVYTLWSPDKKTRLEFGNTSSGQLVYRVWYIQAEIVTWSALGFVIENKNAGDNAVLVSKKANSVREKFAWPLGETDTVSNNYNGAELQYRSANCNFAIMARAYNGSIAFRYIIPRQPGTGNGSISAEKTQFVFPGSYTIYQYNQESIFSPVSIDTFSTTCDFPATLTNKNFFVSIGEAVNTNYTKAELKRGDSAHSLSIVFRRDSLVKTGNDFETPWRTISMATTAIGLHDYSQLYLKFASTSANGVPNRIKPGKLIRARLNTQSGLDCIDFARKHHFQYIMFDAGWYGAEFRTTSDPTQPIAAIDMQQVIQYGKQYAVGVILYVNYVGLRSKLDTLLPLFKQWGVSGIKFGFVDGLTQAGITWLSGAIAKVSDYGFVLNIHDNYKPTGLSRKWPALLTQEGIRGDENSPDAFHNTVLPFTRFLAGPADFTFCFPNPSNSYSKNIKVSKAQQLALSVIYFSPLQSIFWYGLPKEYTNESEIEFFDSVPTVWNESIYLSGEPGKHISVVRRHGSTWYLGTAAGPEGWNGILNMDFLKTMTSYQATIYADDGQGGISKKTRLFKKSDHFAVAIAAAGGQAMIISETGK